MEHLLNEINRQEEVLPNEQEYEALTRIGIALSATRDIPSLFDLILTKAREITSADAGSLYIVESYRPEVSSINKSHKVLRFKLVQNDSGKLPVSESALAMSDASMAGYTALHGEPLCLDDVYLISPELPFRFNSSYDAEAGYRTRSLLSVPMKNTRGEVLGVMQLINCKRDPSSKLKTIEDFDHEVQPFPARSVRLATSLASQAAVAYETSLLYLNIERLVDGFVRASSSAIEQRDPATFGHSNRVAALMVALAEAINRTVSGSYAGVTFTLQEIKELRYASLLHDFGKIAVREKVLVKAKKLEPTQLELLQQRFEYAKQLVETEKTQKQLQAVLQDSPSLRERLDDIDETYRRKKEDLDDDWGFLLALNETSILPLQQGDRLLAIAQKAYVNQSGVSVNLLTDAEFLALSVSRGSLTLQERREIESHVIHGVNFLNAIPWTPELKNISTIVLAHHEKLNGAGYPHGLHGHEIPLASKMMTICDIFDALSASDRPYKKAVKVDRALEILREACEQNEIDGELFEIFLRERVFDVVRHREASASSP